ncbi:MAG: hypothetical protein ACLUKE_05675 [Blautia wexlerae]
MMKSRKNIALRAVFYVVIIIFVMIQIYPIFWVVCSSLKTPDEMTYTAQYALPSGFYLGNYISALTISSIPKYFMNSTIVAVLTLLGIVVLGCPVAFVISKVKVKYAGVLLAFFLFE